MRIKILYSIAFILILASILGFVHSRPQVQTYLINYLYSDNQPIYTQLYNGNDKAIFYVIGEEYGCSSLFKENNLNSSLQFQRAKFNAEFRLAERLSESWGWDFFGFYGCIPLFNNYDYNTILIFFHGHGELRKGNQMFCFKLNHPLEVKKISRKISCKNLTVIVSSCYSKNWHDEFENENLNGLYTSDLKNTISIESQKSFRLPLKPTCYDYPFWYIFESLNFGTFFINALLSNQSYIQANNTAYSIIEDKNWN